MYYDVPGRPRHPFETVNSFVASPLADSIAGSVVTYKFSPSFTINKSPLAITSLQVDFNDGNGLRSVSLSSNVAVTYTIPGYKYLKFIAGFSNSASVTTYAFIKITEAPAQVSGLICDQQDTFGIWSQLPFQGYDETSATNGYGDVRIYYATNGACDKILRKPIIVVDGFDPGDSRKATDLYNDYLNDPSKGEFASNLRSKGYDIVVLNFPQYQIGSVVRDGGADYIERNARVLMALINNVNATKQGNEKLVIIGPSMGGLISRYALAYMEQNSMPHNTRLWVSFDSPHQGANIPIGDQWFLDFYAKKTGSEKLIANRDEKISSVAARQMLVHHYLSNSEYPAGAPGFRDRFMGVLNTIGFPQGDPGQAFRKIALIDGSLGGTEINSAGQKGFTFDIRRRKTTFFFIRWRSFTVSAAKMYFTPSYGSTGTVSDAWYLFSSKINRASAPSSTSGNDVAPGGRFDTQGVLYDEGNGTVEKKFLMAFEARFYSVIRDHSFINTKSALAFTGSNQNLSENISDRNLACTGETPFNSYFGSFTVNREHVELWTEAIDWVTKEIDGIPQPPSSTSSPSISGPDNVCPSGYYSISNLPAGATVSWTATGSISVPPGSTGSSVTVTSTGSGSGTLTAGIISACGNITISKSVTYGPPTLSVSSYVDQTPQPNNYQYLNATATQLPGTVSGDYNWYEEVNGIRGAWLASGLQLSNYPIPPCTTVYYQCVATTSCGEAVYRGYAYNTNCGGYAVSNSLVVYPNPASTELNISNTEETGKKDGTPKDGSNPEFLVRLYNEKGNILRSAKNPKGSKGVKLEIADVPNGTYYLHIIKGKDVFRKQIIIQH